MRSIIFSVFIILLSAGKIHSQAVGEAVASNIARKMKDSLSLTTEQQSQVYHANMQLHDQKMLARQQYATLDSLTLHLQRIENTRDSLYRPILNSGQFSLYLDKKKHLVNNN